MNQDKYISLLYKKQQGSLNTTEKALLDRWLSDAVANRTLAAKIEEDWLLIDTYEPPIDYDLETEYNLLQKRIIADEQHTQATAKVVTISTTRKWYSWVAAASIVFIGIGVWLFIQTNIINKESTNIVYAKKLEEVQLADGTKVWLKANSQLQYPTKFDDNRKVQLTGEALFSVAKNPTQAFIVQTEKADIEVLGTIFNVRAIQNSGITEVIVKEGKVQLSDKSATQKAALEANEKGVLQHRSNQISKEKKENMNELAWQSQVLLFKNTPLSEVIISLERLFEKQIELNMAISSCPLTGRYAPPVLEDILKDIKREFALQSKIENDTIVLTGEGCE